MYMGMKHINLLKIFVGKQNIDSVARWSMIIFGKRNVHNIYNFVEISKL